MALLLFIFSIIKPFLVMIRNTFLLAILLVFVSSSNAQEVFQNLDNNTISFRDWANPLIFQHAPEPFVTGYGIHSDSLQKAYGSIFYELDGEYLAIESWADYYYWFTQKYPVLFRQPSSVYSAYYYLNDLPGMIRFVFLNDNYKGDYFPSSVRINFDNKEQVRFLTNGHIPYTGTPFFDSQGLYRPDLIEKRWQFRNEESGLPFILSGSRGRSSRSEGSTSRSDN